MQRYIPWMLWWATLVHSVIGVLLLFEPSVAELSVLVGLSVFFELGMTPTVLGLVLIVVSAIAAFGLQRERHLSRSQILACILPQYFIVIAAMLSNAIILFEGEFHDRSFPLANGIAGLWPVMAAGFLHTLALLERYVVKWVPRG